MAAVNDKVRAGYELRLFGEKVRGHPGDILGRRKSLHRNDTIDIFSNGIPVLLDLFVPGATLEQYIARRDRIDPDAIPRNRISGVLDKAQQRGLRRGIGYRRRDGIAAGNRGNANDSSPSPVPGPSDEFTREPYSPEEIHVEHPGPFFIRNVPPHDRTASTDGRNNAIGIGSDLRPDLIQRSGDGDRVRHITGDPEDHGIRGLPPHILSSRFDRTGIASAQKDLAALGSQDLAYGLADAPAGACDERRRIIELEFHENTIVPGRVAQKPAAP